MRPARIAAAATAAAALFGGLTACTSSKPAADGKTASPAATSASPSPSPTHPDPKTALQNAAAVMEKAGNAKIQFTGTSFVGDGTGVFVWTAPQQLQLDGAHGDHVRYADGWVYLDVPAKDLETFHNRHWMKFNQQGLDDKVAGADSLVSATAFQAFGPDVELAVAAQSSRLAWADDKALVGGQPTQNYETTVPVQSLLDALPGLDADLKARTLTELKQGGDQVTLDFWIDEKGQLVRSRTAPQTGKPTVITFTGIGADNKADIPSADDVYDVAAELKG